MIYYFIGIKGSGMSSLAQVMNDLGYNVMGSDKSDHFFTEDELIKKGIKIVEFNPDNLKEGMIVIQGNAFNDEFPEVVRAKELNLKIFTYQEMIDNITKDFKLIAVSGCHGKTTTTTMISTILENKGISYLIGDGNGHAINGSEYFALEACEYKRHFLEYHPYYSIITNVEVDHIDYYKDLDDIIDAFTTFANSSKKCTIMCGDDENIRRIKVNKPCIYYGFNDNNDVCAKNIRLVENDKEKINDDTTMIDVYIKGEYFDTYTLPFVGDHLILNVLAAISVCYLENIDKDEIKTQITKIKHAKRRFIEEKFKSNILIDDYAHHPTEVKVTIQAARKKYPNKYIVALFKAHTKSRVKYFYKEFADALNLADKAYVLDIGEDRIENGYDDINPYMIINELKNGEYIGIDDAEKLLQYKDSVLLFMSSKDIYKLADKYKKIA